MFPTSPSSLAILGMRGILDTGFCGSSADLGVTVPFLVVALSSDLCLFCGGPVDCLPDAASPSAGEADRCRFRESGVGDMILFLACTGEGGLLFEPFEMTSSGTVSGISVNLSRAGSYAIDDLRRAGAGTVFPEGDCDCDCGSMAKSWMPVGRDWTTREVLHCQLHFHLHLRSEVLTFLIVLDHVIKSQFYLGDYSRDSRNPSEPRVTLMRVRLCQPCSLTIT